MAIEHGTQNGPDKRDIASYQAWERAGKPNGATIQRRADGEHTVSPSKGTRRKTTPSANDNAHAHRRRQLAIAAAS